MVLANKIPEDKCDYYHRDCKQCKVIVYHPGPNFQEDLRENARRGCILAQQELDHLEEIGNEREEGNINSEIGRAHV